QVAHLAVDAEHAQQVADDIASRAPRQAEMLRALLEAGEDGLPVSELHRDAAQALARKGLVEIVDSEHVRRPGASGLGGESTEFLELTPAQRAAYSSVVEALERKSYHGILLHGVTGSGKTEVYLHSIAAALERGRGAIVLVPEIALTPQMLGRFQARFGDRLALLHSALGQGERHDEWLRVMRGEADLVVGARSAIFAPMRDIGVIVVDEEHERAYKQESPPRYHAVEVARRLARMHDAVLILGGATPSIETYHACETDDDFELCELSERIDDRPLPEVEIVNLRGETLMGKGGTFSQRLVDELGACLDRGEQAMLFLNRRGFSTFVMCRNCGEALRCPECAVSLIYHHQTRDMRCHHCDFALPVPEVCPNCGSDDIGFHGQGTERIADQVQREFENARVLRMDRDTTSHKGAYGDILRRFARGEANVLIGTQMIAKGHHFPGVTLVGVLNADVGLHRPDFRASEHTFSVLTQVAGRAGREDKAGIVLIQTYNPDHPAIVHARNHDYAGFYRQELEKRRENLYPLFTRFINLTVADEDERRAADIARELARNLHELGLEHMRGERQYRGPAPAPLRRLRGRYRYHLLVKGPSIEELGAVVVRAVERLGDAAAAVSIDVDPQDMM
ncbi:MAG: primosomal protein N', partial [Armatimonadetes bacterium]|nr:primosomal protein N' [Armatimonadota bacterium]